jgi:hypothetical protein
MVEIVLTGGPAGGALFKTEAFGWPPPEEIRVVTGGTNGPELLDLPEDEVRPGEQLHLYRRGGYGHVCRPCRPLAWYALERSAPKPEPTLFEAGIRAMR